jgi:hypothetical protein
MQDLQASAQPVRSIDEIAKDAELLRQNLDFRIEEINHEYKELVEHMKGVEARVRRKMQEMADEELKAGKELDHLLAEEIVQVAGE